MTNSTKPTTSYWVISVLALLWNLMGVAVYLGQALMTDDMKAMLPEDQLAIIENTPAWATAAFAIAVWFGLLACILLLARKKLAKTVFTISLIGVIIQVSYFLFMTNALDVYGNTGMIQPIITILISIFLVWYAKKCADDGILK